MISRTNDTKAIIHGVYNNPNTVRNVPKDLGAFQTLVAGWEQVGSRSLTPAKDVYSPMSPSISDLNEMINIGLPLPSPTNTTNKSLALKEQFFRDLSPTPTPTTPLSNTSRTPTTPTYGGSSYRFAGVERLAQRQKIYEPQISSPEARKENVTLKANRDLFFRENITPPNSAMNSNLLTKDIYLSRDRDRDRDRIENMTNSVKTDESKRKQLTKDNDVFVGFSDLPNQIHRKTVKKGFEFTLMVVGESGLGKSTLINSMFLTDIYSDEYPGPSKRASKTVEVETTKVLLKEKTVNLHLTIVDTPGFGGAVDNTNCWQPITNFIENRYEEYLNAETRVHRTHIQDNRVHCCLYFIYPSGHSLKPLDIEFMSHLHDKVNIIPVIAKADTLTPEECLQFKKNIMNEITQNKIKIYEFPDCDDEEEGKVQKQLKNRIPFAVVGSNYVIESAGDRKRGRKYPWGVVDIENMDHCDFVALRNLLIRTYMLDLLDTTNNVHYENFRCRKLTGIGPENKKTIKDMNKNPLAQMEEEKKEHESKMKKMEAEMEQVFEMKVNEKINKLKDSEADLTRRNEEMIKKLEQQRQELEERRSAFEKELAAFELISKDMEEMRRINTLDNNMRDVNWNSVSTEGQNLKQKPKALSNANTCRQM